MSKTLRLDRRARRGVTLLEMLLAIGLITLVSAAMFAFYHQCLRTRDRGQKAVSTRYLARIIANQIAEEIRAANGFVPQLGPGISGTERLITIQTVVIPDKEIFQKQRIDEKLPPAQADIRQIQYYLAYDEDQEHTYNDGEADEIEAHKPLGLVRREIKTFWQVAQFEEDQESAEVDLVSPELKYIRFRYFDGCAWTDKWDIGLDQEGGMGNSLPQAVEITVGFRELPPPNDEDEQEEEEEQKDSDDIEPPPQPYSRDSCTVMVRLPQADTFFGSRMMRAQRRSRMSGGD